MQSAVRVRDLSRNLCCDPGTGVLLNERKLYRHKEPYHRAVPDGECSLSPCFEFKAERGKQTIGTEANFACTMTEERKCNASEQIDNVSSIPIHNTEYG